MAIDWSHLPRLVQDQVCLRLTVQCTNTKSFAKDETTGYWVCVSCRKPSPVVAIKECDLCGKPFVPNTYDEALLDFMGIMCYECQPPSKVS